MLPPLLSSIDCVSTCYPKAHTSAWLQGCPGGLTKAAGARRTLEGAELGADTDGTLPATVGRDAEPHAPPASAQPHEDINILIAGIKVALHRGRQGC